MKSFGAIVLATLAAIANANLIFTNSQYNLVAGQPFTLKWSGASGPVTIILKTGSNPNALNTVKTLDSSDSGNSFTWNVPTDLVTGTYAFFIEDSNGDKNYSPSFQLSGTGTASATGATTTASQSTTMTSVVTTTAMSTSSSAASSSSSAASTSGTSTSSTGTSTASQTSAPTRSGPASTPTNTSEGQRFKSPLAFVLGAVAALIYFS